MKLIKHNDYSLVLIQKNQDFIELINFLKTSESRDSQFIINILDLDLDYNTIVKELLPFHFIWQKTNKSFILVSNIGKNILKELISTRSLEEALDFFHMEKITKNL